jgi:hypothetical protein
MKSAAPMTGAEKRIHLRFDKLFAVVLGSEIYGETVAVARNISAGGMLVQTADILPLGSVVTVHFQIGESDDEIVARAEVKHHLCLNFGSLATDEPLSARGMGLRFLDFDDNLPLSLPGMRVMH